MAIVHSLTNKHIRSSHVLVVIMIAIMTSYANTIYSPFVLDDFHSFIDDPNVYLKHFSLNEFERLSETTFGIKRLIPIATFAIDHIFFTVFGSISQYHFTNILIHILTTFLFYLFLQSLLQLRIKRSLTYYISPNIFTLAAVSIWSLNPIQTNVVTYIVQRMASLVTLFYLLSLYIYIKLRTGNNLSNKKLWFLLFLSIIFASLSKENFATIPFSIITLEFFFFEKKIWDYFTFKSKAVLFILASLLLVSVSSLIIDKLSYVLSIYNYRTFTIEERLLTESRVVLHYISLFLFPLPNRFNLDYDFPISTSLFSPPATLISILFIVFLIFFSVSKRKEYPLVGFGLLWFFITISVESTIIPLEIIFEHRAYLPTIGIAISIISLIDIAICKISRKPWERIHSYYFSLAVVIICSLLSISTTMRNYTWRDALSIQQDCAIKSPNKPRVLLNYANALSDNNRNLEARKIYNDIIKMTKPLREEYLRASSNILNTYETLEELEVGVQLAIKHLKEMPPYANYDDINVFFYSMASAHLRLKKYKLAREFYISSIMNTPGKIELAVTRGLEFSVKESAKDKTDSYFDHEMADIYIDLKRYDLAANYIKRLEQAGEYPEIIETYNNAKKLN